MALFNPLMLDFMCKNALRTARTPATSPLHLANDRLYSCSYALPKGKHLSIHFLPLILLGVALEGGAYLSICVQRRDHPGY